MRRYSWAIRIALIAAIAIVVTTAGSAAAAPLLPSQDPFYAYSGATPLGEALMPGPSDAAWLAGFGARRLMAHLKDGDAPEKALAHALTDAEKSFTALRRRPVREKWETPCASMMLAVENTGALEFLWFGDCTALLQQGDFTAVEKVIDEMRLRGGQASLANFLAARLLLHQHRPRQAANHPG